MNLFDDTGDRSDLLFARHGIAGCLGDDDDPGFTSEPAGLPSTISVQEGSGYSVDPSGRVNLAPDQVDATAATNPSDSGGYGPGAQGTTGPFHAEPTWKAPQFDDEPALPIFAAAPASGGGGAGLLFALAAGGALLLAGQK